MDSMGSPTVAALGALGFALVQQLQSLLASGDGGYIFMILASLSLAWTVVRPNYHEDKPGLLAGHFLAVAVASVLFYGMKAIDLSTTIGNKLGGATLNQGAAPLPTFAIDAIGQTFTETAKKVVTSPPPGSTTLLLPMISQTVREAVGDPGNLADKQVSANLSIWRQVASAMMNEDSTFAAAIRSEKLTNALMNPVVSDAAYVTASDVATSARVISLLGSLNTNASLAHVVCMNAASFAKIAAEYGAGEWVPLDPKCEPNPASQVDIRIVGAVTSDGYGKAISSGSFADPVLSGKASTGASTISGLITANAARTGTTTYSDAAVLYQSLGAGTLVSSAVQAGKSDQFKMMLGEQCQQKSMSVCQHAFVTAVASRADAVTEQDDAVKDTKPNWWQRFKGNFLRSTGGGVAWTVAKLFGVFAQVVAALTPYAIAMGRSIAVVVSLLGLFIMLLPNRAKDGILLLLGPIAYVNLWGILFVFWWWVAEKLADWSLGSQGAWFTGEGSSARAVADFVVATGYVSLPMIAWKLVFSQIESIGGGRGIAGILKYPAMLALGAAYKKVTGRSSQGGGGNGGSRARPSGQVPVNPHSRSA